ncbi:LysR family transcriptional regulator [Caenimonas sedimenti]|uniref:LysR family transcriptional regulator n=1 Tax=Caenimonas sedimenti TaxID=2596921 RepID=A0A562ZDG8_9BURK|nr:LysR substrate-binding domain-containing protein [Caenimonas sedimenti]TWO63078.1 LysR family transcriptional regulator [Caenimonas sedimenti]
MRFSWTDLQIFLHVCEAGSMTAATERAHLTLAAISARIRGLEEGNGVTLLERHARGVSLTSAGEVLARHARLVFEQVQRLERDLIHEEAGHPRRVVLLANSSALARPLTQALAPLCASGDASPLWLVRESASEATVQALRSGAADVGMVSDAVDTRGLAAHDLGPDPLVLIVPRTHPLAARASVAFEDALAQPWVLWGEQTALSTHLLMRTLALGVRIEARVTYPTVAGVLELVRAGAGVTVLPQALVDLHAPDAALACIPIQEPWAQRRLLVCFLKGGDPLRGRLAGSLRAALATGLTRQAVMGR